MKKEKHLAMKQISKIELDILHGLYESTYLNQRILSEKTGYSLGTVNKSLKSLADKGYLDKNAKFTNKTRKLFDSCKPRNAIILAAGFGMRMVPINMTTPKAFVEVDGERLIDRLISQLHEVGVYDITVVVGFMKDSFEYLIDEYGVKLSYAADYSHKNNLHSLNTSIDILGNTYIVPSDVWCEHNPFKENELYSWYMVSDLADEHSDVRVNRKMELVKLSEREVGNSMIGICYLTGGEVDYVRSNIKKYAIDSKYDNKFWEEALYFNDRMIVSARVVSASDIVEIDTYEQLRDLDSDSNQLKSDALETIARVMDCDLNNIVDIEVLKKGMTNRSFLFCIDDGINKGKYIMRIPGEGTELLINREQEALVFDKIRGLGLCDDPVFINPSNGYKITKYLDNVRVCDSEREEDVKMCMEKLRDFHKKKLSVPHAFDIFKQIEFYESLWQGSPSIYHDYKDTKEKIFSLRSFVDGVKKDWCLTHIDAVPDNFLFYKPEGAEQEELQLTDWEYSGMNDPHVDIAMFSIYSLYDKGHIDKLIDLYFNNKCSNENRTKIYCYIAMCGLLWSNWCEYKRNLGIEFGEYSLYQYRYAKDFYKFATERF